MEGFIASTPKKEGGFFPSFTSNYLKPYKDALLSAAAAEMFGDKEDVSCEFLLDES